MKKDSYFQLSSLASDLLREKQAIFASNPSPQPSFYTSSSKKNITQLHSLQPPPIQNKSFQPEGRNQDKERAVQNSSLPVQNPERVKSSSFQQRSGKGSSKFEYLAFVQKQYKEERERKGEEQKEKQRTLPKDNDSAVINQQLGVVKAKMEKYSHQLQRKDELMVRKEKELVEKGNRIVLLQERVAQLEKQCSNCHNNYSFLHEQFLQSQKEKEYYAGAAEKCKQLQAILQQKDVYIQNIIAAKNQEYTALANSRSQEVSTLQQRIAILQHHNSQLLADINDLTTQLAIAPTPSEPQLSSLQISKFQQLGQQFQAKLRFFTDEQQRLKNIISNCEGEIEQLRVQKQSLQATLKAYEERDSTQRGSVLQQELLRLSLALDSEKEEKNRVVSRQELQILRLQNQLASKQMVCDNSLIGLFDQQRLRQSLYLALEQVARLRGN